MRMNECERAERSCAEGPQKFIPATEDSPPIYGKKRKLLTAEEEKLRAARRNVTAGGGGGGGGGGGNPAVVSLDTFREFDYFVLESSKANPEGVMDELKRSRVSEFNAVKTGVGAAGRRLTQDGDADAAAAPGPAEAGV